MFLAGPDRWARRRCNSVLGDGTNPINIGTARFAQRSGYRCADKAPGGCVAVARLPGPSAKVAGEGLS
jgi:hypothetical protein